MSEQSEKPDLRMFTVDELLTELAVRSRAMLFAAVMIAGDCPDQGSVSLHCVGERVLSLGLAAELTDHVQTLNRKFKQRNGGKS